MERQRLTEGIEEGGGGEEKVRQQNELVEEQREGVKNGSSRRTVGEGKGHSWDEVLFRSLSPFS